MSSTYVNDGLEEEEANNHQVRRLFEDELLVFDKVLAEGTAGKVKKAMLKESKEHVALKILKEGGLPELEKEAKFLSKPGLEHIVKLFGICEKLNAIVLKYEEYTLRSFLEEKRKTISPADILTKCRSITFAMLSLRDNGCVHGDLKSSNILVDKTGRLYLCDFSHSSESIGKKVCMSGTMEYMAPEVLCGEEDVDAEKADMWSMGVVIWEMNECCALGEVKNPKKEYEQMIDEGKLNREKDRAKLGDKIYEGMRLQFSKDKGLEPLQKLVEIHCWSQKPHVRFNWAQMKLKIDELDIPEPEKEQNVNIVPEYQICDDVEQAKEMKQGQYVVLGENGEGQLFRRGERLGKVAVKKYDMKKEEERFLGESRLGSVEQKNDGVIEVIGRCRGKETSFVLTEWLGEEYETLEKALKTRGTTIGGWKGVKDLALQIVKGLIWIKKMTDCDSLFKGTLHSGCVMVATKVDLSKVHTKICFGERREENEDKKEQDYDWEKADTWSVGKMIMEMIEYGKVNKNSARGLLEMVEVLCLEKDWKKRARLEIVEKQLKQVKEGEMSNEMFGENVVERLKEEYRNLHLETFDKDASLAMREALLSDTSMNLSIVKKEKEKGKDEERTLEQPIDKNELFGKMGNKGSWLIAMQGSPGVGKTSFCKMVCNYWTERGLWNKEFDCVLRLSLAACVKTGEEDWRLVVAKALFEGKEKETNQFIEWTKKKRILWLLDGLDEVSHIYAEGGVLEKMLDKSVMKCVIVTSRPEALEKVVRDLHVEIKGFEKEGVTNFVKEYFGLRQELKENWRYEELTLEEKLQYQEKMKTLKDALGKDMVDKIMHEEIDRRCSIGPRQEKGKKLLKR